MSKLPKASSSLDKIEKVSLEKSEKQIAPFERVPKPPKTGYTMQPPMHVLSRMSVSELAKVQDFTISNKYGIILFKGKTDLLDLDLGDLITISERSVEVYDERRHAKHAQGTKLNKPAIVTFYNIKAKNPKSGDKYEEKLIKSI